MKTKLQKLALRRIEQLSREAQDIVLKNHEDMGGFCLHDSGFGKLNNRLREIEDWADAMLKDES